MGRLVDADSLIYKLDKRRTYESEIRNKAYGKGVRDAMKDIDAAPTIDAIPVEWLRRWRDVTDIPLLAMNIDSILKVWEESNKYWGEVNKKQEAR